MKKRVGNIIVRKPFSEKNVKHNHYIHMNENYQLYMLLKGDVTFSIDGYLYPLKQYDMLIINNKSIHRVLVNEEKEYERLYIYLNADYFRQFCTREYDFLSIFDRTMEKAFSNKIDQDIVRKYKLDESFRLMYEYYISQQPESRVQMFSLLLHILVETNRAYEECRLLERNDAGGSTGHDEKINDIIRYISENLTTKITLDELTRQFYMSKYYLCREFKRTTGFTVFDYIRYKRMLNAKMLIRNGHPISEVWCELGYEDYSNFYRTFKKTTGMSPKQYLEKVGRTHGLYDENYKK